MGTNDCPVNRLFLFLLIFMTPSCGFIDNYLYPVNKFYSANIDDVNENAEFLPAKIILSEPQVFSRATLQNDRLEEAQHLKRLLDESPTLIYEAQLRRDLSAISILTGQLGIKFDPTSMMAFEQEGLRHEIQSTKLRAELLGVQRQLDDLQADPTKQVEPNQAGGAGENGGGLIPPKFEDLAGMESSLGTLRTRLDALLGKIENGGFAAARKSGINTSPEDRYASMQAYRAMVQSDLSEAKLDDMHDLDGNTLYRLQFMASVLPGPDKNRWGFSRITLSPPDYSEPSLKNLYIEWLRHLTLKLNTYEERTLNPYLAHLGDYRRYYTELGQDTGLFRVELDYMPLKDGISCGSSDDVKNSEYCVFLYLALLPESSTSREAQLARASPKFLDSESPPTEYCNNSLPEKLKAFSQLEASKRLALEALRQEGLFPENINKALERYEAKVKNETLLSKSNLFPHQQSNSALILDNQACNELATKNSLSIQSSGVVSVDGSSPLQIEVPEGFKNDLTSSVGGKDIYKGKTHVYATIPNQRDQRLSTIASAANTMQMAFALAATVPQYGVGMNAGLGYLRSMMGKVDSLERAPLVMGFSGHNENAEHSWLGWIFGPKVRVDPAGNKLKLTHVVARHQIGGDVSIPAWWLGVKLNIESVWVGSWSAFNFQNAGKLPNSTPVSQELSLPVNAAGLDELTRKIANNHGVFLHRIAKRINTNIESVFPPEISVCTPAKTFLIHGANLWRNPEVYLNGSPAPEVRVLPNMAGLRATFGSYGFPTTNSTKQAELRVYTTHGSGEFHIPVMDQGKKERCGSSAVYQLTFNPPPSFINDGPLAYDILGGTPPNAYHAIGLGLRIKGKNKWNKFDASITSDQKKVAAKSAPKLDETKYVDGTVLEAALLITPNENAQDEELNTGETVVFYKKNSPNSKIQINTLNIADIGQGNTVGITLPLNWKDAYPGLKLKAKITKGADTINLSVQPSVSNSTVRQFDVVLGLAPPSNQATYNKLHKGGPLTVTFIAEGDTLYLPVFEGKLTIQQGS